MKIIVESNAIARLENGQVVVNLSRQPREQQARKMELALDTFRGYGWEIEDRRQQDDRQNEHGVVQAN